MSISIITNKTVDTTFEGVPCLLKRTITEIRKRGNIKRYEIVTERCNYQDVEREVLDENGQPTTDENGDFITETVNELVVINEKDKPSQQVYSFDEINGLYEMIKDQIPSGLTKMQTENIEEQIALLVVTQQDEPWNTNSTDWEILN